MWPKLARNAFIGFTSSVVSDVSSNSLRVIKTTKQTSATGKKLHGVLTMTYSLRIIELTLNYHVVY